MQALAIRLDHADKQRNAHHTNCDGDVTDNESCGGDSHPAERAP